MKTLRKTDRGKNRRVHFRSPIHDQLGGSSVSYQLEHVQCGKPKCRRWHGPYWYAYWTSGGRTRSLYIGKTLRPAAEVSDERNARKRRGRAAPQRRRMQQQQLPNVGGMQ